MLNKIHWLFFFICLPLLSADISINNDRDLTKFLQDHTKDHERQIDENLKQPFTPYQDKSSQNPEKDSASACVPIRLIIVSGVSKLSASEVETTTAPFKNKCLTAGMIEDLLRRVTALYHAKGFITSRAALKMPQEFSKDGILEVVVIEGWIEKILFNEGTTRDRIQTRMAFGDIVGEKLNIQDIDNAIEQINRLSSQNATIQIEPGTAVGASVIAVKTQPRDNVQLSLYYRDEGRKLKDKAVLISALSIENPLALNDRLRISYSQKEGDSSKRYERGRSLSYTFPYAFWLFDLTHSNSKYLSTIKGNVITFHSSGFVETTSLNVNRSLFRDQKQKATIDFMVEQRANKSFINKSLIEVASAKVTNAGLNLNYLRYIDSGLIYIDVGAKKGVSWFGADDEIKDIKNDEPHKRFELYTFQTFVNKSLSIFKLSADIEMQYSKDELLISEQFSTVKDMSEDSGRSITLKAGFSPSSLLKYSFLEPIYIDFAYSAAKVETASKEGGANNFASSFVASIHYEKRDYMCQASVEFGGSYPSQNGYSRKDYPNQKISCMVNFKFL
jgi:hemolysin activation/secretion protein